MAHKPTYEYTSICTYKDHSNKNLTTYLNNGWEIDNMSTAGGGSSGYIYITYLLKRETNGGQRRKNTI